MRQEAQAAQEALAAEAQNVLEENLEGAAEDPEPVKEPAPFEPSGKEIPDLPPLDGSATPLAPVDESTGMSLPVILATAGGAIGLCAAAFIFLL